MKKIIGSLLCVLALSGCVFEAFRSAYGDEWMAKELNYEYHITYNNVCNADNSGNPTSFHYVDSITISDVARIGYTFDGWYDAQTGGNKVTGWEANTKTDDVKIWARWTPISYNIIYKDKDNTEFTGDKTGLPTKHTFGTDTALVSPTRTGYKFGGWYAASDCTGQELTKIGATAYTDDVILYALWMEKDVHRIIYQNTKDADNSVNPNSFKEKDDVVVNDLSVTGYTFDGWYDASTDGNKVTGWNAGAKTDDVNLWARWTPISYTITFDSNGGSGEMQDQIFTYDVSQDLNGCTFTAPEGKKFECWNTEQDGTGTEYNANQFIFNLTDTSQTFTLYAQWMNQNEYRIVYKNVTEYDNSINPKRYRETNDVMLNDLPKEGYIFGWYDAETGGNKVTGWTAGLKSNDITLWARWIAITYTITYNNVNDVNNNNPAIYTIEDNVVLSDLVRMGYTFDGWYDAGMDGNKVTGWNAGDMTGDVTLWAGWTWGYKCSVEQMSSLLDSVSESNGPYSIMIIDDVPDLSVIKTALQTHSEVNVELDLSNCNELTSIGDAAFENCSGLTSIEITNSVTSIGDSAFSGCSGLTGIMIPDSVTSIGYSAFSGCSGLTEQVSNANIFAFMPKSYIGSYAIPRGITNIAGGAFSGCSSLTIIEIPNSVTSIGKYAFSSCSGLTSVTIEADADFSNADLCFTKNNIRYQILNKNSVSVVSNPYSGDIAIPSTVTLGNSFTVTRIGGGAFMYRSGLTSVEIPNSVTSIGDRAFSGCSGLKSITIPDSVTNIGNSAFQSCSGLTSVTIPDGVMCIDIQAFSGCSGLESVTIPSSVTSIGIAAFYDCRRLTSVTIPDSVTSIGDGAFWFCSGLTSVTIPDSVTSIEENAFRDCSRLTSVTIPDSVTSIGGRAFEGCNRLTSVTIPDSVTSIGYSAFNGCSGLTTLTVKATIPPTFGNNMLQNCSKLTTVYVPSASVDAYKAADGWRSYANKIEGKDFE